MKLVARPSHQRQQCVTGNVLDVKPARAQAPKCLRAPAVAAIRREPYLTGCRKLRATILFRRAHIRGRSTLQPNRA
ncbi:MAG: hypothetical protein JO216_03360 [Hyphomicrobiales bacterium]|nr:hypothetical protein [Hyphomicrobiales bacterium]MBW0002500.1 hypothetical protein [Hyphomicrobiales bacterium]